MHAVRIETAGRGEMLIDVTCDCGRNGLTNAETGEASFKHYAETRPEQSDTILVCRCGKKYRLHPQRGHVHISQEP